MLLRVILAAQPDDRWVGMVLLGWSCTKQGRAHHLWRGNESS